jgi:hypothetical protein
MIFTEVKLLYPHYPGYVQHRSLTDFRITDFATSQIADWWQEARHAADQQIDSFIATYPKLWVVKAYVKAIMLPMPISPWESLDQIIDVLRAGEGAAEFAESGRIWPLVQDILRGIAIAGGVWDLGQEGSLAIGKSMKLYEDVGNGTCQVIAFANAIRRAGRRFFMSLEEIARAHGYASLAQIDPFGLFMGESIHALKVLQIPYRVIPPGFSLEKIAQIAAQEDGVVMVGVKSLNAVDAHAVALEKAGAGFRIIDRGGIYSSFEELAQHNGFSMYVPNGNAPAIVVKNITTGLLNGLPKFFALAGLKLSFGLDTTTDRLNQKLGEFESSGPDVSPPESAAELPAPAPLIFKGTEVPVVKGDTLSGLSLKYYHRVEYWPLIFDANPQISNADVIRPGMVVLVPPLQKFNEKQRADALRRHRAWPRSALRSFK